MHIVSFADALERGEWISQGLSPFSSYYKNLTKLFIAQMDLFERERDQQAHAPAIIRAAEILKIQIESR